MRRWNGWGDDATSMNLNKSARAMMGQLLGPGHPGQDAERKALLKKVPTTRLPTNPLIETDASS